MSEPQQTPQRALARFATGSWLAGGWALLSTLLVTAAFFVIEARAPLFAVPLFALPLACVMVRIFVIQHDAGHGGLLPSQRANRLAGQALSALTGVPFEPWRAEHAWHHQHQGKLWLRGVDRVNSPVTVREAQADPTLARQRIRFIRLPVVLIGGLHSLFVKRKRLAGFFMFRDGYKGQAPRVGALRASLAVTILTNLAWHASMIEWLGWARWSMGVLFPVLLSGSMGAALFWAQHNFPDGFHAEEGAWDFTRVALRGSSYLKLPPPLGWCSGYIGLHHVHHLNSKVPLYRLEEARRAVPELAAVAPLDLGRLRRSFRALFWDEASGQFVGGEQL